MVSSSGTALTEEQIRLINRLTKNITLLFDSDAAGLRASLRGVDLILEQGMNVKICTFPEGEDPDSFARKNTIEELTLYLEENARDFINFKASLLVNEAKNDPIKKADTIRDMVTSISKIPDVIKREIYIKECSRIMDISEEVLFNSLAQILIKTKKEESKKQSKLSEKPFEVVIKESKTAEKIDVKFQLELKILELLLLYGSETVTFEDELMEAGEDGQIKNVKEKKERKVFQKVYLDIQEDEMEFTNPVFQDLFNTIIENYQQEKPLQTETFIAQLEFEKAKIITDIFMDEEKYQLHDWERKDIYVKEKKHSISQLLNETILHLRKLLIAKQINSLAQEINQKEEEDKYDLLQTIQEYKKLEVTLSRKLETVVRRFE